MIRRRGFMTLLGGAAAWPLAARAQEPPRVRRVGILMAFSATDPDIRARVAAFRQELGRLGWSDGNLRIDERWPADDMDRVRADTAELISGKPEVILVAGRRAVAVCCCSDSRSSLSSRVFSIAMTA
jgi:putative tryptophan/tyrosine transport system substrate-binding protein